MLFANICKLCEEKKIKIYKLERECNLGNGTISGWKESDPSLSNVKRVADYFETTIDELLKKEPEKVEE